MVNNLFDILNSKNQNANNFKRPMNAENIEVYRQHFQASWDYIGELMVQQERQGKMVRIKVVNTINKTGFMGFLIAIQSFNEMFKRHVEDRAELEEIACYRFSQDHLKMFFSAIRAKG